MKKQVLSILSCAVVLGATFTACSGTDPGTVGGGSSSSGSGSGSGGGNSSSSSSSGAGSSSSSGAASSSSSSSSGAGSSSSSSSSSGAGSSSSSSGAASSSSGAGSSSSSGGGGVDAGGIACGMGTLCEPPMECCTVRTRVDAGVLVTTQTCVAAGACAAGGVSLECSSELSCGAGQMCCRAGVAIGGGGADAAVVTPGSTTCQATCARGSTPVCLTDAGCPAGNTCIIPMGAAAGVCRPGAPPPRDAGAGG